MAMLCCLYIILKSCIFEVKLNTKSFTWRNPESLTHWTHPSRAEKPGFTVLMSNLVCFFLLHIISILLFCCVSFVIHNFTFHFLVFVPTWIPSVSLDVMMTGSPDLHKEKTLEIKSTTERIKCIKRTDSSLSGLSSDSCQSTDLCGGGGNLLACLLSVERRGFSTCSRLLLSACGQTAAGGSATSTKQEKCYSISFLRMLKKLLF